MLFAVSSFVPIGVFEHATSHYLLPCSSSTRITRDCVYVLVNRVTDCVCPPGVCVAVIHKFDYVFAENGTVQYKDGKLFSKRVSALMK